MVFAGSLIELVLFNVFGRWFKPNLLVVLVIFINLYLGIRYSLITAVFAGVIRDSFSLGIFGVHIFSFVACAYLTTFIRTYHYQVGSSTSRFFLILVVSLANVVIHYAISVMFLSADFGQMFVSILLPEVLVTVMVAFYIFKILKRLALAVSL